MSTIDPTPIETAARDALSQFAQALLQTCAAAGAGAFIAAGAAEVARAVAQKADLGFAHDLAGAVVADVDRDGIDLGPDNSVHVATNLAKFAQGDRSVSPIQSVSVQHTLALPLPAISGNYGEIAPSGSLNLQVTFAAKAGGDGTTTTIAAKISFAVDYSAPEITLPN